MVTYPLERFAGQPKSKSYRLRDSKESYLKKEYTKALLWGSLLDNDHPCYPNLKDGLWNVLYIHMVTTTYEKTLHWSNFTIRNVRMNASRRSSRSLLIFFLHIYFWLNCSWFCWKIMNTICRSHCYAHKSFWCHEKFHAKTLHIYLQICPITNDA